MCFVGFAPRRAPEIVVVALFDRGGVGQYAAPIVRDVVKSYLDKKTKADVAAGTIHGGGGRVVSASAG
jgi:cell division protein FtsI/penicillin-binding protein 2